MILIGFKKPERVRELLVLRRVQEALRDMEVNLGDMEANIWKNLVKS
jgi:hypothetical protein